MCSLEWAEVPENVLFGTQILRWKVEAYISAAKDWLGWGVQAVRWSNDVVDNEHMNKKSSKSRRPCAA